MSLPPLVCLFSDEISNVIEKFRDSGITVGDVVSVLEEQKFLLFISSHSVVSREEGGEEGCDE